MPSPTVSFVVPCYNLARFLTECVNSILTQTYGDLEVLIMDDCSTDETAEVAHSFRDARVKYVRNDSNLGALPNYNKGIGLSRGKYVWLISADDYLRRPYVLQRYVDLMETHSEVGYIFCPAVEVRNGNETGPIEYSSYGEGDRVTNGRVFLQTLLDRCLVMAPTAMARRECYDKISLFPIKPIWAGRPIDMIWCGDWYLWSLFALQKDVAYLAEPMVCYRQHDLSSTSIVTKEKIENCFHAEIALRWIIKQHADKAGLRDVSGKCLKAVAIEYARHLTTKQYRSTSSTVTMTQFEESLSQSTASKRERNWVRGRVFAEMGDKYQSRGDIASAEKYYSDALRLDPSLLKVRIKRLLLSLGKMGDFLRRSLARLTLAG